MVSLKIKGGTPVSVKKGIVDINGPCVALYEAGKGEDMKLVVAYHLLPGETVKKGDGEDYIVEF